MARVHRSALTRLNSVDLREGSECASRERFVGNPLPQSDGWGEDRGAETHTGFPAWWTDVWDLVATTTSEGFGCPLGQVVVCPQWAFSRQRLHGSQENVPAGTTYIVFLHPNPAVIVWCWHALCTGSMYTGYSSNVAPFCEYNPVVVAVLHSNAKSLRRTPQKLCSFCSQSVVETNVFTLCVSRH